MDTRDAPRLGVSRETSRHVRDATMRTKPRQEAQLQRTRSTRGRREPTYRMRIDDHGRVNEPVPVRTRRLLRRVVTAQVATSPHGSLDLRSAQNPESALATFVAQAKECHSICDVSVYGLYGDSPPRVSSQSIFTRCRRRPLDRHPLPETLSLIAHSQASPPESNHR